MNSNKSHLKDFFQATSDFSSTRFLQTLSRPVRIVVLITGIMIQSLLVGCSSTPHKVKDVDTKIDQQGQMYDSKIGINKDNQAVIQTETAPEQELNSVIWRNNELEQQLTLENSRLRGCRRDLADPRLGGDGNAVETPSIDDMLESEMAKTEVGLNDAGKLTVVKKELLVERLERENKKSSVLKSLHRTVKRHRESCEQQMGIARVKAGLPAERFSPTIEYDSQGRATVKEKGEVNLDEAFRRIGARKRIGAKKENTSPSEKPNSTEDSEE